MALDLTIAGITVGFVGDGGFMDDLRAVYEPFVADEKPMLTVKTSIEPSPHASHTGTVGTLPELVFEQGMVQGPGLRCTLDLDRGCGSLSLIRDRKIFDMALRAIYSLVLTGNNGAFVHAAAIESRGKGFLFYGPSEAGKTTISRMSQACGKRVLTDELAAVRRIDGRYCVFGTPFRGECDDAAWAEGFELCAAVQPVKSDSFCLKPVPLLDTVLPLMQSIVSFGSAPRVNAQLLDTATGLARSVGRARMEFAMTDNLWKELDRVWN